MLQDDFYLKKEANDFFDRWSLTSGKEYDGYLRQNKKSILSLIDKNLSLHNLRVLEVGCFVGDLLSHLKENFSCDVFGIEASSKACEKSKNLFNLEIENSNFIGSSIFKLEKSVQSSFDLIIFDDVLSWMGRNNILQVIAITDWLLRDGGSIFIRDFSPGFSFAYENHHQKGSGIYNFKQSNGHRKFFLESGMYFEKYSKVYTDKLLQKVVTQRPDSSIWSDSLITKSKEHLFPILTM